MPQDYNVDAILQEIRRKKSSANPTSNAPERNYIESENSSQFSSQPQYQQPAHSVQHQSAQPAFQNQTDHMFSREQTQTALHPSHVNRTAVSRPPQQNDPMGFGNLQPLGTRRRKPKPMAQPPRYIPQQNADTYRHPQQQPPFPPNDQAFHFQTDQEFDPMNQSEQPLTFDPSDNAESFVFPDIPAEPMQAQPQEFENHRQMHQFEADIPQEPTDFSFHFPTNESDLGSQTVSHAAPVQTKAMEFDQAEPQQGYQRQDDFFEMDQFATREMLDQDPYLDDLYASLEDYEEAKKEIQSDRIGWGIKVTLTGILAILSIYLAFSLQPLALAEKLGVPNGLLFLPPFMLPEQDMRIFLIVNVGVCVLAGIFCSQALSSGIGSLCCMRANCDSPAGLAFLGVLIQGILLIIFPETLSENPSISLYFPVAVLILFFCASGHRMQAARIERNFNRMTSDQAKFSLTQIQNRDFAREFSRGLGPDVDRVAYSAQSGFFSGFSAQSHSSDYSENFSRLVSPICFIGAVLVGVLTYVLAKEPVTAVTAATAILCICAPFSSTILPNLMLSKMAKKLTQQGAVLTGYNAAEELSETGAVVISDRDLFPEDNVMLHGMKVFAEKRIDEAILDAASVVLSCNGVLSGVFLNMIGGNRQMLKQVDNLTYEDSMGISAWVNGKRVLIGNSQLMHHHKIECPSRDFESRYNRDGRQILYLSNSGELTAMFVVSYNPDEDTEEILNSFERHGVCVSVYTNDPNITRELISLTYGVKKSSVRILPASIHSEYKLLVKEKERIPAKGIHSGGLRGIKMLIKSACAVRRSVTRSTIIQLIGIIVGYGLIAFMAFSGSLSSAPFQTLILYHLGWLIISSIAARVIRW